MSKENNQNQQEKERLDEYLSFVKDAANSGEYFSDALDWYISRYVNPIVDRTIMIAVSVIAAISLFFLFQIVSHAFPLVETTPIVIRDYDASRFRPIIHPLRDKHDETIKNVDEAVARYLITNYVQDRESYDFRDSNVASVNDKFERVKNNSSLSEYKNFQLFMSRDNVNSPINDFGRNIYKTVEVTSFQFLRQNQGGYEKIKSIFGVPMPKNAEVKFVITTRKTEDDGSKIVAKQNYLARLNFEFGGVNRDAKSGVLRFGVKEYQLFKVN